MGALPSGTVTFLFTDVEGSTRLLHDLGAERYAESLVEHRRIVRQACSDENGVEVDTQGDAFFIAFPRADHAVRAADAISKAFGGGPIRVRIGLHTGRPLPAEEGYVGEDVHFGARIAAAGHGGQVLLSAATRLVIGDLFAVTNLGEHRLKDFSQPVAIFQLGTDTFPPLKTISNTNLPWPADSFIGREHELADVVARVHSQNRLLTLAGPGGSGKTRLAIEAAASLLTDFKAGVFWVDLVPVRDSDGVAVAVAATLTTEQDLVTHIGEREMLLVLDNLEHVIDAAPWVGSLVRACPNLSVLVTSRERLRIHGESLVQVPPLDGTASGRLFVERSGVSRSADVEALCARLEHLPLAIELAAARAPSLTPRQMLDRLGTRLDLFKGARDVDPRQRTLRATIDWSYELLTTNEQRLFRRLSVFVGGTTLEGIETVCEADLDTVESLIDKSLLRATDARYAMLETVREYAAERLEAVGEGAEVRARHAAFIRDLMAAGIPALLSGNDELGRSLTAEFGNLQTAFASLVKTGDAISAAELIDTVWWFVEGWACQSRVGLAMCDAVLRMPQLTKDHRALVRHREGNFALSSDPDRARRAWRGAAALARRIGDKPREANVLSNLSLIEADPAEALRLFERSTALAPPEDERAVHRAQLISSGLNRRAGHIAAAEAMAAEVVAWGTLAGDYQILADADLVAGDMALQRGDAARALERATRSRDLGASRNHALIVLIAETLRCRAAVRLGRFDDAQQSLADLMDVIGESDVEAAGELDEMVLRAAVEVLAAVGDAALASKLESVRRRLADARPWLMADAQREHRDWLAATGAAVTTEPEHMDVRSALELVRGWLRRRPHRRPKVGIRLGHGL